MHISPRFSARSESARQFYEGIFWFIDHTVNWVFFPSSVGSFLAGIESNNFYAQCTLYMCIHCIYKVLWGEGVKLQYLCRFVFVCFILYNTNFMKKHKFNDKKIIIHWQCFVGLCIFVYILAGYLAPCPHGMRWLAPRILVQSVRAGKLVVDFSCTFSKIFISWALFTVSFYCVFKPKC